MTEDTTKSIGIKTLYAAFQILVENDSKMLGRDVVDILASTLDFSNYELETLPSGGIRWKKILSFFTVTAVKSGFLRKNKGIWYVTELGEETFEQGSEILFQEAQDGYKRWQEKQQSSITPFINDESLNKIDDKLEYQQTLDTLNGEAYRSIQKFIESLSPADFQYLVAALLRGMGYYVPFVSTRGVPDGGIDIIAYLDPIGAQTPHIKSQVKHRPNTNISVNEIRALIGVLHKDQDIGFFVTSGGFTKEALKTARFSLVHVECVDLDRFISLWQDYYPKMNDEDKNLMPLNNVYFLDNLQ